MMAVHNSGDFLLIAVGCLAVMAACVGLFMVLTRCAVRNRVNFYVSTKRGKVRW